MLPEMYRLLPLQSEWHRMMSGQNMAIESAALEAMQILDKRDAHGASRQDHLVLHGAWKASANYPDDYRRSDVFLHA